MQRHISASTRPRTRLSAMCDMSRSISPSDAGIMSRSLYDVGVMFSA